MNLKGIENRARALEEKMPTSTRQPHLCVILSTEPSDVREAKLRAAEREGDPVIEVMLVETPTAPAEVLS